MPHHPTELDRALAQLGLIKLGQTDLESVLRQVTDFAARSIAGATEVSITIVAAGRAYTPAFTTEMALRLDEAQYELQAGPCLEAAGERATVLVPDTARDTRWNGWPARAAAVGAGSVLSIGLTILDDLDGALNFYRRAADAFDDAAVRAALSFVRHASVTLTNAHLFDRTARLAQQMESAMAHRSVIEQAKGIIMGERRCSADDAFAVLTRISQDSNRKLRDIAAAVVLRTQSSPARAPREPQ
jgi:hypothetical protein